MLFFTLCSSQFYQMCTVKADLVIEPAGALIKFEIILYLFFYSHNIFIL